MSDLVSKAVGTLGNLFSNINLANSSDGKANRSSFPLSRCFDLASFTRTVKNVSSKKEEEEIVSKYLTAAEKLLLQPNVKDSEVENCVQLVMICESLEYSAPFAYVHAIKLAQKGNLKQKQTGYLAAASLLSCNHDLVILLVNTIQKDLESQYHAEIMLGLKAVCNLISSETVHNVMFLVEERLKHEKSEVRKLAVLALEHCLRLANSDNAYKLSFPKLEKTLSDSDLGVVAVTVPVIYEVVKHCSGDYSYLIDSLVQLQSQLLQRRVPHDLMYKNVPAPWLQINILKFFSLLCDDQQKSEKVFPVLKATLQKAEVNLNIAYAVVAEFVETVTSIKFNNEMIQLAMSAASKLVSSDDRLFFLAGIQVLTTVAQRIKPSMPSTQQENIMKGLHDDDETLKKKTLELLYFLVNPSNAHAICRKFLECMASKIDEDLKKDIALKVLAIAKQYNEDAIWYISTVNDVLVEAGNLIPVQSIYEIIDIIQNDSTGALKKTAKDAYFSMCQESCPPSSIVKIISCILDCPYEFERNFSRLFKQVDDSSATWLLISLQKLLMKNKKIPDGLKNILTSRKCSSMNLQQTMDETVNICNEINRMQHMEFATEVDMTLSFLDQYVNQALLDGSPCYIPPRLRAAELIPENDFETFSKSSVGSKVSLPWDTNIQEMDAIASPSSKSFSYKSLNSSSFPTPSCSSSGDIHHVPSRGKSVWTKEGRLKTEEKNTETADQTTRTEDNTVAQLFAGLSS